MQQTDYERRGYLHEDFHLFHLSSALAEDTAFHYHEFHKLVFFLAGRGNYIVEGRTHVLRPYDVVLVRQGAIHKAQIDPSQRYERVILYISPEFLRAQSTAASQLDACFRLPADGQSFVLRPEAGRRAALLRALDALEEEERSTAYGHDLLARAQMLQLLVMLGRGLDDDRPEDAHHGVHARIGQRQPAAVGAHEGPRCASRRPFQLSHGHVDADHASLRGREFERHGASPAGHIEDLGGPGRHRPGQPAVGSRTPGAQASHHVLGQAWSVLMDPVQVGRPVEAALHGVRRA